MLKHRFFIFNLLLISLVISGCSHGQTEPARTEFVLNTLCTITLYDRGNDAAYARMFGRLREIESRMSATREDSDIARVNKAAGVAPVAVHEDVFAVVERALYYAELSDGAFDPTVGPLVALWGIGTDRARLPSKAEIAAVLPLVNRHDVVLDKAARTVFLRRPGMALDLGAIAKGYAADELAKIAGETRIPRAIIDLGGNILVYGKKADGKSWRVGVQDPLGDRGAYLGVLTMQSGTLVTSGIYERFFEEGGVRYHHLLNPVDGYPARNGLYSVSIIAATSTDADALSTAVFVSGYEKGRALAEKAGVRAIFTFEDKTVRTVGNPDFVISNNEYKLIQ